MSRVFKPGKLPECGSGYLSVHKILNIIIDRIICHGPFHNIIGVGDPPAAGYDKIQPFLCHLFKHQIVQSRIRRIFISIYKTCFPIPGCPPYSLLPVLGAVKAKIKVLIKSGLSDFGKFYGLAAAMV